VKVVSEFASSSSSDGLLARYVATVRSIQTYYTEFLGDDISSVLDEMRLINSQVVFRFG
jgi:hypothetical protein